MRNVVPTQAEPEPSPVRPAQAAPPVVEQPTTSPRSRRPRRTSTYDRVTRVVGLLVACALMVALWTAGGYFTLSWLASIGLAQANAGTAFVDALLSHGPPIADHWLAILLAWSIPGGVTVLEIWLWPVRTRHPFTWFLFLAVLAFSSFTSAAGIAQSLHADPITAWVIGGVLGIILDLVPEKGKRVCWRLLWES